MQTGLQTLDYIVFLFYFFVVAGYGIWIDGRKRATTGTSAENICRVDFSRAPTDRFWPFADRTGNLSAMQSKAAGRLL